MLKLLILCYLMNLGESLMFILIPNTVRCLREQVTRDVMLIGEFNVSYSNGQEVDYVVTDSRREILARNDNVKTGRFSVVTERDEMYEICFRSRAKSQIYGQTHTLSLVTMKGVEIDKLLDNEKSKKLQDADFKFKRLKSLAASIVHDFKVLNENEQKIRSTNESTNSRVLYLGVFSIIWLLTLSSGQLYYLYRYFKSKKVIE